MGRPTESRDPNAAFYGAEDLRALAAYAADRFFTVVPEVDTPGHASALIRMHPALNTGRNNVEFEFPPGQAAHCGLGLTPSRILTTFPKASKPVG